MSALNRIFKPNIIFVIYHWKDTEIEHTFQIIACQWSYFPYFNISRVMLIRVSKVGQKPYIYNIFSRQNVCLKPYFHVKWIF